MAAIMANDKNQIGQLLQESFSLLERNYLGQTALHLAVIRPKLLANLVARFDNLDVDEPARHGVTPLMYAATYGEDVSVITLLRAGADLCKRDDLNKCNFLDYALGRENWNVLDRTIQDCKLLYSPSRSQSIVDYVTVRLLRDFRPLDRGTHLRRLLSLGADPNVTCPDGSTLLHHVWDSDEAEALFEAGFRRINDPDERGVRPLMELVRHSCLTLVQKCLERAASVSDQDDRGWTVLHYAVQVLRCKLLYPHRHQLYLKRQGELAMSLPSFGCCSGMERILEPQIIVRVLALKPDVHQPQFFWERVDPSLRSTMEIYGRWNGSKSYLKRSRKGFAGGSWWRWFVPCVSR